MEYVPDDPMLVREERSVFERMFRAMEKVKERLDRCCAALEAGDVPYALIGGNAVAAWVATVDDGAVRATRDVDLLLQEEDLERATAVLAAVGFERDRLMEVTVFLDGPDGKPSQGIHILFAGQKVNDSYTSASPTVEQFKEIDDKRVVKLEELVRMKLNSYRRKDQTHLLDMIGVGLIDSTWPTRYDAVLGTRLQELLDDPDG